MKTGSGDKDQTIEALRKEIADLKKKIEGMGSSSSDQDKKL